MILASASPRRRELLVQMGLTFQVVPSTVEERERFDGEDPRSYAMALAAEKGNAVALNYPDVLVLSADTVVAKGGVVFGKPGDVAEAVAMLRELRGESHHVITSVTAQRQGRVVSDAQAAIVRMRHASDEDLYDYARSGEPFDKAGAYAIQGLGHRLVESYRGCYYAIVGLPLCVTSRLLTEFDLQLESAAGLCRHSDQT